MTTALCALSDEPAELVKLRQQFHDRLKQEMQPWRARYVGELEKLEKTLATAGRLEEALVVKQERLKSTTVEAAAEKKEAANPRQAAELQKVMEGTYWIVFDPQDEKRENMRDVYEFRANGIFVNFIYSNFYFFGQILIYDQSSLISFVVGINYNFILVIYRS